MTAVAARAFEQASQWLHGDHGGRPEGDKVVVSANFLIDAESNLQAALRAFTSSDTHTDAPQQEAQP